MSNDRFENIVLSPPTSAKMLIMLIYYYWFQFPRLCLLEAVPLKLQPRRIWIKIPEITNGFQLCLAEERLLNEQHCVCVCAHVNAWFLFGSFESRTPAIGWFCVSWQPMGLKRGWFWIRSQPRRCVWYVKPLLPLSPKGVWKAPFQLTVLLSMTHLKFKTPCFFIQQGVMCLGIWDTCRLIWRAFVNVEGQH